MNTPVKRGMGARSPFSQSVEPPLLSICIPTRDRPTRILPLVMRLIQVVQPYGDAVEIIVSDNSSTNETAAALGSLRAVGLQFHRQLTKHGTAEAHVFSATGLCRGTYVWFLGDDDIPVPETLNHAIELLKTDEHDFLFFNSALIDERGGLTGGSVVRMNAESLNLDFAKGAVAIGLMSSFAGLSNSIMRRERLSEAAWREIPARSIIYSHVTWWLICFADCRLSVVNRPLVFYRVAESAETFARFQALAEELNWPDHHFWGEGLIDLLDLLERRGVLDAADIGAMFEARRDGSFGRALDDIAYAIFRQAAESVAPIGHRNRISGTALQALTGWLERIDPSYQDCIQVIRRIHALRPDPASDQDRREPLDLTTRVGAPNLAALEGEFRGLHAHISARNTPFVGLAAFSGPFKIFRHISGFVAISSNLVLVRQEVLRTIDPASEPDGIIVAPTLDHLFARLGEITRTSSIEAPDIPEPPMVAERDAARAELVAIRTSTIWRATALARAIISALRAAKL